MSQHKYIINSHHPIFGSSRNEVLSRDGVTLAPSSPIDRAYADRTALTLGEVSRLLGIDPRTLRGHVRAGRIAFLAIGTGVRRPRRRFLRRHVEDFLDALQSRGGRTVPDREALDMIVRDILAPRRRSRVKARRE